MRTKFYLAVMVALCMVSCSQNEAIESGMDTIKFDTYVGKTTKAAVTQATGLQTNGFKVQAYYTAAAVWASRTVATEFMSCDVTYSSSVWTYNPLKYWPGNVTGTTTPGKVSFFAVYPKTISFTAPEAASDGAGPKFDYTVGATASVQTDVVVAMAADKDKNFGRVGLTFKHTLAKIGFSAKLAESYSSATIKVTSVGVVYENDKVKSNGTLSIANDGVLSWVDASVPAYMSTSDAINSNEVTINSTTATAIDNSNYLMMIPQAVDEGDMKVKIAYTVDGIASEAVLGIPAVTWTVGKQYTYTYTISLTAVEFESVTVDPWKNDEDVDL